MDLKITGLTLGGKSVNPAYTKLASFEVTVSGQVTIRFCSLLHDDDQVFVAAPVGRRGGLYPVTWKRNGEFAKLVTAAAVAAYEHLTGEPVTLSRPALS